MEFTACLGELIPEGTMTSFAICDAYCSCVVGQA